MTGDMILSAKPREEDVNAIKLKAVDPDNHTESAMSLKIKTNLGISGERPGKQKNSFQQSRNS